MKRNNADGPLSRLQLDSIAAPFGPYAGKPLCPCPDDFLERLLNQHHQLTRLGRDAAMSILEKRRRLNLVRHESSSKLWHQEGPWLALRAAWQKPGLPHSLTRRRPP